MHPHNNRVLLKRNMSHGSRPFHRGEERDWWGSLVGGGGWAGVGVGGMEMSDFFLWNTHAFKLRNNNSNQKESIKLWSTQRITQSATRRLKVTWKQKNQINIYMYELTLLTKKLRPPPPLPDNTHRMHTHICTWQWNAYTVKFLFRICILFLPHNGTGHFLFPQTPETVLSISEDRQTKQKHQHMC